VIAPVHSFHSSKKEEEKEWRANTDNSACPLLVSLPRVEGEKERKSEERKKGSNARGLGKGNQEEEEGERSRTLLLRAQKRAKIRKRAAEHVLPLSAGRGRRSSLKKKPEKKRKEFTLRSPATYGAGR